MKMSKGFTLIELLVVIAIIGILSSVVLASLTTARTRGQVASVQSQLSNMRAQAELYYSTNGNSYGTATDCSTELFGTANNGLGALVAGIQSTGAQIDCNASSTAWSAVAAFGGVNYCVDSTGFSGTSSVATADNTCL